MTHTAPIAIVLPPGEGFGPVGTGAIGTLVHRLARLDPVNTIVFGPRQSGPVFDDIAYRSVDPVKGWPARGWPVSSADRYARGAAEALASSEPSLIEVHNRVEVAVALADRFPAARVALFLHNDPQAMRTARSDFQRERLLAELSLVVTVSRFLRDRMIAGVLADRPPVVLPNCLDLSALPPRLPPDQREKVILFAGRVVADKGADSFVAACARALPRLPGWRAEIIGADRFSADSPETPFLRTLRPRAAAAGVTMRGYQPLSEVLRALSSAAIAVVPSRWREPFGLAALEAIACGAPLVCAERGGLPEVAGDAAVYIDPDDPAAIGDAIVALAQNPERRAALAAQGLIRARLFDTPRIHRQLAQMRRDLLALG